ncbi:hypothetical protein ACSC9U_07890 [Pseudomonas solani]|nr:hypothetical protein [Pseudomonas solani]MDN4146853.1 hypothetical protein [Pseudomonas tohonis]
MQDDKDDTINDPGNEDPGSAVERLPEDDAEVHPDDPDIQGDDGSGDPQ